MSETTNYNITHSQVGAVGPNTSVSNSSLSQQVAQYAETIDAKALAADLALLQVELQKRASERDHYAGLVAVSDAAADAKEGKIAGAVSKLAAAGKWALGVATSIGTTVAAGAIKHAMGL